LPECPQRAKVALYDYEETRSGAHPRRFLAGFEGYLQVDGYAGYRDLPGGETRRVLAHARRKFDEAVKALAPQRRQGETAAEEGLAYCNRLFAIEHQIRDASAEERRRVRERESGKVLSEFRTWLDEKAKEVLPQSALGRAVHYCLTQWPKLVTYLEDGKLES
jgi:transposase